MSLYSTAVSCFAVRHFRPRGILTGYCLLSLVYYYELDSDRSVCMAAICYRGPIRASLENAQWFEQQNMPNFVDIQVSCQMKKFLHTVFQALDSDRSVCMAATCYSDPISAIPTSEQLVVEKNTCANFKYFKFAYIQTDKA